MQQSTPHPRPRRRTGLALAAATLLVAAPALWGTSVTPARALDNGLARTPPMGWNNFNAYDQNITDALVRKTADKMVSSGMKDAGYVYVNIDDSWMASTRDGNGNLQADPAKFPNGIKAVADYVHSKGLKLGIYEDAGLQTCAKKPGSLGHEEADAKLFASWGVDYLKYDNCYAGQGCAQVSCPNGTKVAAKTRYKAMRDALAATGRPIVFSICSWGEDDVWAWGKDYGNSWRTTGDIKANWSRMLEIYKANVKLAGYAGPGHWNDPDMLETGNGMSATEDRAFFSLWAQMAAPLISGSNLVDASQTTLSILTNKQVIAVDQDSLGKQSTLVSSADGLDVLAKPLANGDVSVVLFNQNDTAKSIYTTLTAIGKTGSGTRTITDLWTGAKSTTTGTVKAAVPAHGAVMVRVSG
ncbi:glycoside hydrolase family 27 protein [Streptomyces sp. NPDC058464]|uniref:glycoside hydrolase family 27 protein n=1 Tax=Streptomyces sp. NPDC058464 TaxID=3346511 RepID=UPI003666999E